MSDYTCLSFSATGSVFIAETNCSNAQTVGWVSNPNGRGTISLVLSCILTLGLCVWSAMHLNIPAPTDTERQVLWRNARWIFMGVFGPELVMYVAWRQFSSSKALFEKAKECVSVRESSPPSEPGPGSTKMEPPSPIYTWTLMHSFYANMGGFVFHIDPSDDYPAFFPGPQSLTLSDRGVALIAELGHLPNIAKDDIADKSKSDGLAKAFVMLQASWIVVQVISRSILSLPVTLLEVNTLGHAFCALVVYVLWWHKPRLIEQATVLRGDWVRAVCAYMYMSSQISGWSCRHDSLLRRNWKEPEFNSMVLSAVKKNDMTSQIANNNQTLTTTVESLAGVSHDSSTGARSQTSVIQQPEIELMDITVTKASNDVSPANEDTGKEYFQFRPRSEAEAEEGQLSTGPTIQTAEDLAMQVLRWQLAAQAIRTYPILQSRFSPLDVGPAESQCLIPEVEQLLTRYSSNWPSPALLNRSATEGKKMGMVLWCASMVYGAVHVAAWDYYFPSRTESILWKSSAIFITASGLIWLLINGLAHKSHYWNRYWSRFVNMRSAWYSYFIIGFLSSVCGIAYILSRLYLVIEAIVSIRRLPLAAYATPDWIQTIPHL